jgi:hypothetical protein
MEALSFILIAWGVLLAADVVNAWKRNRMIDERFDCPLSFSDSVGDVRVWQQNPSLQKLKTA